MMTGANLNQLLAEMEAIDPTKASAFGPPTNRPRAGSGLLRPAGATAHIIDVQSGAVGHTSGPYPKIKQAETQREKVALATTRLRGADLANLVNEAALRAVQRAEAVIQETLLRLRVVIAAREKKQCPGRI